MFKRFLLTGLGLTAIAASFFGRKRSHKLRGSDEELQLALGEMPGNVTTGPAA